MNVVMSLHFFHDITKCVQHQPPAENTVVSTDAAEYTKKVLESTELQ